ncbi:dna-directed rna polymerases i ii and iii subunit rpabc2 [Holotrichia oblita]|uniref:Dna-directed rna polymerases i ii and iii subunit rpabc2 n=1 Tax=Holotrichia oblita TaxID=644536 RepID=A0ACB9SXY6_HOLOL|nr:dna-directed rna polymerases i ii and iii subunit rpabc2 [Holotrichia oblita]
MESRGKRLVALCKNVNVQMLSEEEASNHKSPQNDSSSTDDEPLTVKRNRWTKSQPEKWKKNVMKEKRSMGQPYRSTKGILRPAKTPKPARCDGYQCEVCNKFKNKSLSQEDYKQHLQRRDQANAAKANDKIRANEDTTFISVSFDLQSVLHIPSSQVSMMYYSLKLCAYNLTIYEAALPNKAFCYAWSEVNGQRGSSEIGSALYKWIETIPTNVKEISLFSDTCSGQNRNQYIAALFLYIVQ